MKIHFTPNDGHRPACRPHLDALDVASYTCSEERAEVTCRTCLKQLRLSTTILKTESKHASCILRLPNGKESAPFRVTGVEYRVERTPALEDKSAFITFEPEPVHVEIRLSEDGLKIVRELVLSALKNGLEVDSGD